jgi:hypothetical protein
MGIWKRRRPSRGAAPSLSQEGDSQAVPADRQRCLTCRHFRNDPRYLESVFRGMNILSSAYGSVRSNDGICRLHDLYLSADACCPDYRPRSAGYGLIENSD